MTLAEIVTLAYQMGEQIGPGDSPTTAEAAHGLTFAKALVYELLGMEAARAVTTLDISADLTTDVEDRRYRVEDGYSVTVTISGTVTHNVHGQDVEEAPYNGARIHVVGSGINATWLYNASLADWVRIDSLGDGSENPFGPEHDLGLAALIAVEVTPMAMLPAKVAMRAEKARSDIRIRFRKRAVVPADPAVLLLSRQAAGDYHTELPS